MQDVKTVSKEQIIKRTAIKINGKPHNIKKIVSATFTTLREVMEEANPEIRIEIRGFGIIEVKTTKAKPKARNPKTGATIYIPARKKTHFKPGKILRGELKRPL